MIGSEALVSLILIIKELIRGPGSAGNAVLDYRDRAISKFFLYSGARLSTACRLKVSDFHQDGDEATIRLHEKGDKRRTIGLHFQAAQAIAEYIEKAGLTSGPLFRPLLHNGAEEQQRSFDSTCRKLHRFLTQVQS
jgi:integrase